MKIKMFADLQLSRRYLFLLDNELITPVSNCQVWLIIFFSASVKGTFPRFANGTLAVPSCLQFTFFFKNRWAVFPGNWEFGFKGREVLLHSAAVMQQGEVFKPALKNSFEKSFREIYALVSEELCACPLPSIGIRPPGPQQKLHSQTMQFKILEASVCKVCLCQSLLCSYINTFVFYPHPFTLAYLVSDGLVAEHFMSGKSHPVKKVLWSLQYFSKNFGVCFSHEDHGWVSLVR